jgi:hypothetical protein
MEASMIIRDGLRSLVGTLCGACIVTLVALGFGAAPARAQTFTPLPPQVAFISNGKYTGTLIVDGKTMPITGAIEYLTGDIHYLKIEVDPTTGAQLITSDTWLTQTATAIKQWEIVSTDPTTCRREVVWRFLSTVHRMEPHAKGPLFSNMHCHRARQQDHS